MTEPLSVVFDINVWANGIVGPYSEFPYLPQLPPTTENSAADCISLAFDPERFSVFISPHILRNLGRVLKEYGLSGPLIQRSLEDIVEVVHFSQGSVIEPDRVAVAQQDFEDNLILDLVLASNSDVLVTADRELLENNGWKGRAILHPTAFVKLALGVKTN